MRMFFYLSLVCVFLSLASYTGCTKAGSVTGTAVGDHNRKVTVTSDKGTIVNGASAIISTEITTADGSLLSGGGVLGETGTDLTIEVSYSSNSNGSVVSSSDSDTFTLAASTTTTAPETASSVFFSTTATASAVGILTISVTHLDIVASVNITVIASL